MELRDLQNFLAVAQEGNISAASNALHIAQPSLSRQMRELEEELGKTLFTRGSRKITLTEEGLILRRRAEEMLSLLEMTEKEISDAGENMTGDIHIGAAESKAVHYITRAAGKLRQSYPNIHFHISSGDTNDTLFQLDQGLIDFALLFYLDNTDKYHAIHLPVCDHWGILVKKDHPLAKREAVSFRKDLKKEPLIMSRLTTKGEVSGVKASGLNIVATYNLAYNASLMVEDGLGIAVCFDSIVNISRGHERNLRFVPIDDMQIDIHPAIIWKKYQAMPRVAKAFIDELRKNL